MKTIRMFIMTMMLAIATSVSAMSYHEAREKALFLSDKMAYELGLTEEQYEAVYQINLDYLMNMDRHDIYGNYWGYRNSSLAYVLSDWQYTRYLAADYFYRPVYWRSNAYHFRVYDRYYDRDFYYRARPRVYITYRGDHDRFWYNSRTWRQPKKVKVIKENHNRDFGHFNDNRYNGNRYEVNRNRDFGNGNGALGSTRRNPEPMSRPNNNGSRAFGGHR